MQNSINKNIYFEISAQILAVIFVGKCRIAIGFFMIFMQFLGAFFGAVYAQWILQNRAFAVAMHATMHWTSTTNIYATNGLQYFFMELTLSTLICCAYLFTGVISSGKNGTLCASVVAIIRVRLALLLLLHIPLLAKQQIWPGLLACPLRHTYFCPHIMNGDSFMYLFLLI
ncbi:unnamed protein product [Onchocerca flexuosa]|uniref:7TM_GPCR_Srx domain-containing protein n=1 Tax=Onchocerca flexuosa TaxID=387005 RepID=A0A183HT19_9BILA|nr:unnamed protein product [Onchocerca flexuosa]